MSESGWLTVKFNPDMAPIIKQAIDLVRSETGRPDLSRERALELLCADKLSGGLP